MVFPPYLDNTLLLKPSQTSCLTAWQTRLLVLVLTQLATASEDPPPSNANRPVRLLTIGNSFSRNATRFLADLAEAGGHPLNHTSIVVGGASLELHATKALLHDQDPCDPEGLYEPSKRSLKQELQAQPWDFVTIQQASIKSHDAATYQPYAQQLADLVATYAPTARLLVHQTWPYRQDDPRFAPDTPHKPGQPDTQLAMYKGLKQAYYDIANHLNAGLIPVGDAFHLADSHPHWAYQPDITFNFDTATPPALPSQAHSLHIGWRWVTRKKDDVVDVDDDQKSLQIDGHHASPAGEYLGACVFYEVIFQDSVLDNTFVPTDLDPLYAHFLRETAHRAVAAARFMNEPSRPSPTFPRSPGPKARIPQKAATSSSPE